MPPSSNASQKVVGILTREGGKLLLQPTNKKGKTEGYAVNFNTDAKEGDIVVADLLPQTGGKQQANVTRILGQRNTPGILTTISLYEQGLSEIFSQAALKQAKSATVPELGDREDLRNVPLVTVDGPDSRDFDDAIFAEDTPDGGKHLIVAIADVSWYVRPDDDLDKEAFRRGNSTYLPDRAVPMLPEELSNGLCSLNQGVDRAVLAAHLWIDKDGNLTRKEVRRGLMRSAARLTYEQLQAARDGKPDATTAPLMDTVVNPLYEAYDVLKKASQNRGALDLSMPEYEIKLDDNGNPIDMTPADDAESHNVIAEFMILANVATDELLEEKGETGVHRVHDVPPEKKIQSLVEYLDGYGLTLPKLPVTSPHDFKEIIEKAQQLPEGSQIIKTIARSMAKAKYSTQNIGHFGLALRIYGHFTSPIRRFADLLQHRKLVKAFNLGAGAITPQQEARLEEMVGHINDTELLSVRAERAANDRYAAAYLKTKTDTEFKGHVTGVIGSGLFVTLDGMGVEGMLPVRNLRDDYYNFDANKQTLTGRKNGKVFKPGDELTVRVKDANELTGSISFTPANDNEAATSPQQKASPPKKHKQKNRGHRPR